jgi:subtilisin family serine protease
MSSTRLVLFTVLALALLWGGNAVAGIVPGYPYVPGEVLIKFKPETTPAQRTALLDQMPSSKVNDLSLIKVEQRRLTNMSVEEAIRRFDNDPRVAYIEPNYILRADVIPNDPRFPDLWGLNNTGQSVPGGRPGTPDADIDAPEAWTVFTGSQDVIVCVIDTGVNYNHQDLAANIWTNPGEIAGNGIDDDGNGFVDDIHGWDFVNGDNDPMDDHGHGSHCSGTIGGVGDNGIGVAGVNWHVRIMGCKFLDSGGYGSTANAILCVQYATMMHVDVMSNSWGGGPYDQAMYDAIQAAYAQEIFFVAAAGNSGTDNDATPHYPSSYANGNVVAVMATDMDDRPVNEPGWWATCYGATSVDIAAPGLFVWSTVLGQNYDNYSGTSMATPHVSGALALLRGRFPNITVDAGKNLLLNVGRDPLSSLAGKCVSGARLNLLKLISDPDETPPSQVTDLAASGVASNWIQLTWTAPADDYTTMTGVCSAYDLRYSTSPIDDTSWATATQVIGEPNPQPPGSTETFRVNGLGFSTTYYFAIKALDEYGNQSPLSNVPSATTLGAPTVAVAPTSLSAILETGGTTSQTLTVSNVGEGVLDFTIPSAEYIQPSKASFAAVQQHDYVELQKDAVDTRPPNPQFFGSGGPDAFGYRWRDSDEPGGPAYNWIEIDGSGTAIALASDDQNLGPFPIGFTFPFYGNNFTTFNVCSNGWVSFTNTTTAYSNSALPAAGAPGNLLALFWDDLTFTSGGDVYYQYDGTRLIIEYKNVPHYSAGGPYSMEIHLYPNGQIDYMYQSMTSPLDSATIGIQNADGTDGLTVVYNAAYVHDNMAVRFASIPPWLSTSPNSGSIAAGASVDVTVGFNASGLCGSHFDANLHVLSNDPVTPDAVVPVGLDLIGQPDLQAGPTSLAFGPVYITATRTLDLIVTNAGCADLHVTGLSFDHPDFGSTLTAPFTLIAGASQTVPVVFAPSTAGPITGTLELTSDDPDTPTFGVALSGVGLDFPDIQVSPTSLVETLPTGGTATQTLQICNTGLGDLNFTIPEAEYVISKAKRVTPAGSEPIELAKGAADPRVGDPVLLGAGGPDLFGYRWKDSDEPGGPAYNWIEIDEVGTQIAFNGDDQNLGPFPIGFSFSYYGNAFNSFRACSNGWVSFTSTEVTYTNYALPSASAPENLLAAFHDDLTFSTSGTAYYYNDGTRMIIEYKNVPHLSTGGPYTFQIQIYPGGKIEYHYQTMTPGRLNEATIGIQNATKDDGLTVVFNAEYVHDSMAIRFQALPSWLSTTPNSGTVPPGGCADILVGFNAAELCGDQYLANLHVMSNDPDTPDAVVPVTLNMIGEPDAQLSAAALDFGSVYLTQSSTRQLAIANAGCATLNVTGLTIDNAVFTTAATPPFTVPVGGQVIVNLTFAPVAGGPATGTLTVTTDDPDTPVQTVGLAGVGLLNAVVSVNPTSIYESQPPTVVRTRSLRIANNGQGQLNFTIPSPEMYNKTGSTPAEPRALVTFPKGAVETNTGDPVIDGAGGPDAYGYRWKDSDEPGGPTFGWVEIGTTGTVAIASGDDSNQGPFPIGFTFKYYGTNHTTFRVCSNGFLSFTSAATTYNNTAIPSTSAPLDMLAPFWDDLNVTGTAKVVYQVVGGALVVEWFQVPHYGTPAGGPYTFEIILYPNGKIVYQYLTLGTTRLNECTVGIQNATGTDGLQSVFNAAYLHDSMAIRFAALPEWLTVAPTSGTVPPHGFIDVTVTLNSTEMEIGTHSGQIRVLSNDIVTPEVLVPVTLQVLGATDVADGALPTVHAMSQNLPNPFAEGTKIQFSLPSQARVDLRIYDVRGALVRTLVAADMPPGYCWVTWDGRTDSGAQAASGMYYYKLRADGYEIVRHMTLVR